MALPLEVQNVQVVNNLLELLGIEGASRWDILPTVVPVAIVSGIDRTKVEKFAFGTATMAAVAAENSHVQLFNPANSGVIVHASQCIPVLPSGTATCSIAPFDTALTTDNTTKGFRDRRLPGTPVAQVRMQSNAGLLTADNRLIFSILVDESPLIPLDIFLEAGQGIVLINNTVNVVMRASFYWDEAAA